MQNSMIMGQRFVLTSPSSFVKPAYNNGHCIKNLTRIRKGLHALSLLDQSNNINTVGNGLTATNSATTLKYNTVKNSRMASPSNKHKRRHTSYQYPHQITSAPSVDSKKDHVLTIQLGQDSSYNSSDQSEDEEHDANQTCKIKPFDPARQNLKRNESIQRYTERRISLETVLRPKKDLEIVSIDPKMDEMFEKATTMVSHQDSKVFIEDQHLQTLNTTGTVDEGKYFQTAYPVGEENEALSTNQFDTDASCLEPKLTNTDGQQIKKQMNRMIHFSKMTLGSSFATVDESSVENKYKTQRNSPSKTRQVSAAHWFNTKNSSQAQLAGDGNVSKILNRVRTQETLNMNSRHSMDQLLHKNHDRLMRQWKHKYKKSLQRARTRKQQSMEVGAAGAVEDDGCGGGILKKMTIGPFMKCTTGDTYQKFATTQPEFNGGAKYGGGILVLDDQIGSQGMTSRQQSPQKQIQTAAAAAFQSCHTIDMSLEPAAIEEQERCTTLYTNNSHQKCARPDANQTVQLSRKSNFFMKKSQARKRLTNSNAPSKNNNNDSNYILMPVLNQAIPIAEKTQLVGSQLQSAFTRHNRSNKTMEPQKAGAAISISVAASLKEKPMSRQISSKCTIDLQPSHVKSATHDHSSQIVDTPANMKWQFSARYDHTKSQSVLPSGRNSSLEGDSGTGGASAVKIGQPQHQPKQAVLATASAADNVSQSMHRMILLNQRRPSLQGRQKSSEAITNKTAVSPVIHALKVSHTNLSNKSIQMQLVPCPEQAPIPESPTDTAQDEPSRKVAEPKNATRRASKVQMQQLQELLMHGGTKTGDRAKDPLNVRFDMTDKPKHLADKSASFLVPSAGINSRNPTSPSQHTSTAKKQKTDKV